MTPIARGFYKARQRNRCSVGLTIGAQRSFVVETEGGWWEPRPRPQYTLPVVHCTPLPPSPPARVTPVSVAGISAGREECSRARGDLSEVKSLLHVHFLIKRGNPLRKGRRLHVFCVGATLAPAARGVGRPEPERNRRPCPSLLFVSAEFSSAKDILLMRLLGFAEMSSRGVARGGVGQCLQHPIGQLPQSMAATRRLALSLSCSARWSAASAACSARCACRSTVSTPSASWVSRAARG